LRLRTRRAAQRYGKRDASAYQKAISHPLTSGRKYACDDGCATTDAVHDYHRLLRWQPVFSSPTPTIGIAKQNAAGRDIYATA